MKILIVGSGGREHALAWHCARGGHHRVYAAPGNPGIARVGTCYPASTVDEYFALADHIGVDLTVVGPEAPLVAGIVDKFRAAGKPIVGPTAAAARLEGSKSFSKGFMVRAGIPTARFQAIADEAGVWKAVAELGYPIVLKADGLAAGKGVVIANSEEEVEAALPVVLGGPIVVEEFLAGEEVSFIVVSDGANAIALQPSQDHKAVWDGDKGSNTGGMGAYCDRRILTPEQQADIMTRVVKPTLEHMAAEGNPFSGFLYAGLMMTSDGPKVLEFNARLGDPETQAILHSMRSDFAPALLASARGDLAGVALDWNGGPSVCVVMAAEGYPGQVRSGDAITGIEQAEATGAVVFQAGTREAGGQIVTSGGRVLGVTARGDDLRTAISAAYHAVEQICFEGMHYRSDIGAKGLRRSRT
ncbi:MAG TPA: phosphoribosylamine--glycine ligase [Bryobacteraceae bacterium]|nr:phosphoribosylamine--glycine ligase [Bryobacteraceae bacterium]